MSSSSPRPAAARAFVSAIQSSPSSRRRPPGARTGTTDLTLRELGVKLKVEMTLTGETAQKLQGPAKRLVGMNLGEDGILAAVVLLRIVASYERARQTAGADTAEAISLESLYAENDE